MTGTAARSSDEQERGFIKVIATARNRHVILGRPAGCAQEPPTSSRSFPTAIVNGLTCAQLSSVIRPHPTFCEGVTEAVEDVHGMAIHLAPKKR